MKNRPLLIAIVIIALIIILPLAWWLGSPLFINNQVDEAFPFDLPSTEAMADMSAEEKDEMVTEILAAVSDPEVMGNIPKETMEKVEETVIELAAEMPDKEMEEEMPEAAADEWIVAKEGTFMDADSFHKGSGTATIYQQGGTKVLRFEDFESTNGPDLHVLLVENIEGTSSDELGEYIDLGSLKGNIGNQNYEISADVDFDQFGGVMIYCMSFHVVFSTAAF